MKVYKRFITGIAAIALLFSGLVGCETPTGDPGPRGTDVPHLLVIESDTTVVAPGGIGYEFKAIFKGIDNVSNDVLTKWEITGDGLYTNYTGPGTVANGKHDGTTFTGVNASAAIVEVSEYEQAETLQITASYGGYNASATVTMGARDLPFIRLKHVDAGVAGVHDATTRIDLYESKTPGGGSPALTVADERNISTQPAFGYYFVYEITDKEVTNVPANYQVNVQNTVNEEKDLLVKNGDWITVYEVPQDELLNTAVRGFVSLQVHSSVSDVIGTVPPDTGRHDVYVPNIFEPVEFSSVPNTTVDMGNPGSGLTTSQITYGTNYPTIFGENYQAYAIDEATWLALDKDAPLPSSATGRPVSGPSVELPTVGKWELVVQHKASGAWWQIDDADVTHNSYAKAWEKTSAQNILRITLTGGKALKDYRGIAVNGIPFSGVPISTWSTAFIPGTTMPVGNTFVELYLGDMDMTAPAATPGLSPESQFVAGQGTGVIVSIPADHFIISTAPVSRQDPDIQVSWSVDSSIRGRVITTGIPKPLKDDDVSTVMVQNPYTRANITAFYNFEWFFVDGLKWESTGQTGSTYTGQGTEAGKYLGLKVTAQSGFRVHGDSEFVFGAFSD
jgi:hypothetical protein